MKLRSFAAGEWYESKAPGAELTDAVTGETLAEISSEGLDFASMVDYARRVGGANLRRYTFHQRAAMLGALAKLLNEKKTDFYALSTSTGATKRDSWLDIDGGIGTLFVYSSKGRREMPNDHVYIDGAPEIIGKRGTFVGQHVFVPLQGVALHINAFNFPCWGMLEKLGPTLLAGVPAIVKPASSTAYLTARVFDAIIEAEILPEGAVQLVCGSTGDLMDHLNCQDVIAFTGSKSTADRLRQHPNVISQSIRFTAETDSLNASILGPDATPDAPEFELYVNEVVREITVKAGQKCTAIRRIIAPRASVGDLVETLAERLAGVRVGNPANEEIDMGALASLTQREEVSARVRELSAEAEIVYGDLEDFEIIGADRDRGAFLAPILLQCEDPANAQAVHSVEAFGPVGTVVPYSSVDEAIALANRGEGSLAGSIFTYDDEVARELVLGIAPYHGRVLIVNRDCAKESTGHGSPLPHLVHGGPGRAGGGEEMGGIRGVLHYMQRTAVQGSPTTVGHVAHRWIRGGIERESEPHPFRKTFEALELGDTVNLSEHLLSDDDLDGGFAEALTQSLLGATDPNPLGSASGIDSLRLFKPVQAGDQVKTRVTCKQKTLPEGAKAGEVRWDVEVSNSDGDIVAQYDLLSRVALG